MTSKTPLQEMIDIQKLQERLDRAKEQQREANKIIRSLAQEIPKRIRSLRLR